MLGNLKSTKKKPSTLSPLDVFPQAFIHIYIFCLYIIGNILK